MFNSIQSGTFGNGITYTGVIIFLTMSHSFEGSLLFVFMVGELQVTEISDDYCNLDRQSARILGASEADPATTFAAVVEEYPEAVIEGESSICLLKVIIGKSIP